MDLTLRLLGQGYETIAWDRAARGGGDDFPSRLLGRRALVLRSAEGARAFYDESLVSRKDVTPLPLPWLSHGRGSVHGMDGPNTAVASC